MSKEQARHVGSSVCSNWNICCMPNPSTESKYLDYAMHLRRGFLDLNHCRKGGPIILAMKSAFAPGEIKKKKQKANYMRAGFKLPTFVRMLTEAGKWRRRHSRLESYVLPKLFGNQVGNFLATPCVITKVTLRTKRLTRCFRKAEGCSLSSA